MPTLTQERLKSLLEYDPETGVFRWRVTGPGRVAGKQWGCLNADGYVQGRVDYRNCLGHHLAWLYMLGEMPSGVDHENGIRADNRWKNLRPATVKQNAENRRPHRQNRVGRIGVCFIARNRLRPWLAHICHNDERITLGVFPTLVEAVAARIRAERRFFTHAPTCGAA
jgi:HNH endonuclease